jgi:hypothetical protein
LFYYFGDLFSDKKTEPSTIKCISNIKYEHLFGYYDKSPWNSSGNQIVYLRVSNARHNSASSKTAYIVLKDLLENKEKIIGKTNSWNTQQGCMAWTRLYFKNYIQ